MTTCKVHNVKFYKLEPKGINCMTYEKKYKKLALSRTDGTLEIWNIGNTPFVERTIPFQSNSSVEALCWYEDRLFSVGLRAQLIEYNLVNLAPKYSIPITGEAGWCMDVHKTTQTLAIGTEQGYLNLYSITDNGVDYVKILDKQEGRILCLKFNATGTHIASGSVDVIRIWNVSTGHAIHKMNVARLAHNTETVVWCLAVTTSFTIISGDSRGFITFWDGTSGSQLESYQSHSAPILTLCLSEDEKTVYCSGIDPLITCYEYINVKDNKKWVRSIQRNIHDHDVRALILSDGKLYSGGVDGYLALSYYSPKTFVKYPPVLQNPVVSIARDRKFIMLRNHKSVELWTLGEAEDDSASEGLLKLKEQPKKVLELQTVAEEGTLCSAVSNDAQWIVYSTMHKLRLFILNYNENDNPELISITNLPIECGSSVRAEFTPNSKQLILAPRNGGLQMLNLTDNDVFLVQSIDTTNYLHDTITFLIVSPCGKYLIAADPLSNIIVWNWADDSWKHYSTLPRYSAGAPTTLNVHPGSNNLLIVYDDHKIIEYSLVGKKFTNFSRSLSENLPQQWSNRLFPVINITFDPRADHILLLHDDANICVIDKNKKLPAAHTKIPKLESSFNVDGFVSGGHLEHAFRMIKKYKHLVHFSWLAKDGEMIAVELSPLSFFEKLPPAFPKKKFGTK